LGGRSDNVYPNNTGPEYCSIYQMILVRDSKGGKSTFTNVSQQLLYVYLDTDADGKPEVRVPLFADSLDDYYWYYDNNNLRVAQLRFYEIPTVVEDVDPYDPPTTASTFKKTR
jgi:hypothetical protein